jgi:hypothetical protein
MKMFLLILLVLMGIVQCQQIADNEVMIKYIEEECCHACEIS